MPKHEGLRIKDSRGCTIFLHQMKFYQEFKLKDFPRSFAAGFYSQTIHEDGKGGMDEYTTYWGCTKPTPKQFRRMKKRLRRSI